MEQYAKRHTPGPWKIEQELIDDPRLDIADITAPVPGTQYKTEIARVYCENRKGATVGPNARLIAAAPDLLAIVEGMVMYPDAKNHIAAKFPGLIKQAEAAIAKAQGGAK